MTSGLGSYRGAHCAVWKFGLSNLLRPPSCSKIPRLSLSLPRTPLPVGLVGPESLGQWPLAEILELASGSSGTGHHTVSPVSRGSVGVAIRGCRCLLWAHLPGLLFLLSVAMVTSPLLSHSPAVPLSLVSTRTVPLVWFRLVSSLLCWCLTLTSSDLTLGTSFCAHTPAHLLRPLPFFLSL